MKDDFGKWIFETLTGRLKEEYKLPGVENAYADGAYCMEQYHKLREAYGSLCQRLGKDEEEDQDVETIIHCYMDIEEYIGMRMFEYGVQFGRTENRWSFWKEANELYLSLYKRSRP